MTRTAPLVCGPRPVARAHGVVLWGLEGSGCRVERSAVAAEGLMGARQQEGERVCACLLLYLPLALPLRVPA